ncbi:hypothetical protein [Streptomyces sp. I4(2020)]|uniref:hypothetical protein n=1 Tax=Streptomyces sp. I4(2020) TaxID=2760981 RepID=UPI0018EE953C|nr:hypothetical protein [Streptomyces sp. I4(2020)]MBJ6615549.1 hypothetical protein [Streptomyces sp. I3(2020)]MBJ6626046.1 hypothetical protein [Streptomyces sp. I4(2020)]
MTTDEDLNQPAGTAELQRLQDKYRKQNIANDRARELVEEDINSGRYSEEQADEISRNFEQSCREELDRIQDQIEAHCRAYKLRSTASQWADE